MNKLEQEIRAGLKEKEILLMTHLVLGYPSFAENREVIRQMVNAGVDIIELQIPFSEPVADGPVILKANQEAISRGTKVRQCLDFAAEMCATHPIPFLFMTYYNILFKYGTVDFLKKSKDCGIRGFIVPDLPVEESEEYLRYSKELGLSAIQIYTPVSEEDRLSLLAKHASGFIYCMARRGVTGSPTSFDDEFADYMKRCRQATELPLAVGFGISNKADVEMLKGKAEIAVIGSATIRLVEEKGAAAVGDFINGLR